DLALRTLDLPREHLALDRLALLHAGALQQPLGALGITEDAHQGVLERQVEPARARIALAAGPAAELIVDAPRLVPLRADDVQPARRDDLLVPALPVLLERRERRLVRIDELRALGGEVAAEHDVRAAAGHVR